MSLQAINLNDDYKSCFIRWDKLASIRKRPRRILDLEIANSGYYYPFERQPICIHPLVKARGDDVIRQILIHTAYKFMLDIAHVEVMLINQTALKVYQGTIDYNFPVALKTDMLSIIIDEAYHAYVAYDFVAQVSKITGITSFYQPGQVELGVCLERYLQKLPDYLHLVFELIAICIGENTLIKELFSMTKHPELNPFFHQVMADHMIDEGRHSEIFRKILAHTWLQLDDKVKCEIGKLLPMFIIDYVGSELHDAFNEQLLYQLQFPKDQITKIIEDTRTVTDSKKLLRTNPVAKNILDMLRTVGIFSHQQTLNTFVEFGLVNEIESTITID